VRKGACRGFGVWAPREAGLHLVGGERGDDGGRAELQPLVVRAHQRGDGAEEGLRRKEPAVLSGAAALCKACQR
jgi:hypothetical protein